MQRCGTLVAYLISCHEVSWAYLKNRVDGSPVLKRLNQQICRFGATPLTKGISINASFSRRLKLHCF